MRILIVEDEEHLSDALAKGLRAEGFDVDIASSGTDGLERARERVHNLIILDILLPELNGFAICATLRAEENWVPILMLTAKTGEWDEAESLDTGADDFLSKPFSFVVLLARVRALLRRGRDQRPSVLKAGDLILDPTAHRCQRGSVDIDLTPREFALLSYLLQFPGEALTKRQILIHVWGEEFDGDPNIVEVYVGYLRRKIDDPFGCSTIDTVRGLGYRIAADPPLET